MKTSLELLVSTSTPERSHRQLQFFVYDDGSSQSSNPFGYFSTSLFISSLALWSYQHYITRWTHRLLTYSFRNFWVFGNIVETRKS